MVWTVDKFLKAFGVDVSDDLLTHQGGLVDKEIQRLEANIVKLKNANIGTRAYEVEVATLKSAKTKALRGDDKNENYKKLEKVEKDAARNADNAARALKIEPSDKDVDNLKKLIEVKGTEGLTDRIDKLKGKAGNDSEKKLVIAAIKARWGLENLNGDLSSRALPRLYKAMAMVPEDHIKGNTSLKEIRRDRESDEAPCYSSNDKSIALNCPKTGKSTATLVDDNGNQHEANYFDHTTLHEIAHAVDDRLGFMKRKGKLAQYGGWRGEGRTSVAKAAMEEFGFADDFDQPRGLLSKYLQKVLETGKAEPQASLWDDPFSQRIIQSGVTKKELLDDPGIKKLSELFDDWQDNGWPSTPEGSDAYKAVTLKDTKKSVANKVIETLLYEKKPAEDIIDDMLNIPDAPPTDEEWAEMARHPAVAWCQKVRLQTKDSGMWEQGKSAAAANAIGGRVYQQSYESEWFSYDPSRPESISAYQFRAPGEWFSELYAAFYMGWLKKDHWIGKLKMPKPGT